MAKDSPTKKALGLLDTLVIKGNPNTDKGKSAINKVKEALTLLQDALPDIPKLSRYIEAIEDVVDSSDTSEPSKEKDEEE